MQPIVVDFETVELLSDGSTRGSTEAYRDNFRVDSCAFSRWDDATQSLKSYFIRGEAAVADELRKIGPDVELIAHNIQFEILVSRCRFPHIKLNWAVDTMRLVQNWDNGGDKFAFEKVETLDDVLDSVLERAERENGGDKKDAKAVKPKSISGFGLVKSVKRILPKEFHDHKSEAHEWILANVPEAKKGKEGRFLDRLPLDILERYNIGDTENTYRLYKKITDGFAELVFDWRFDHHLYLRSVRQIVDAKIRGVHVDRPRLDAYRLDVEAEIAQIATSFREKFEEDIRKVERQKKLAIIRKLKTLKGRKKRLKAYKTNEEKYKEDVMFNIGSNKQLEALFVGVLKMPIKFKTAKENPSFRSAVLSQWGDGGEMLKKRRKRLLVLKQAEALLSLSRYDGRWHHDLRAAGTSTGRYSGGQH